MIEKIASYIQQKIGNRHPQVGLILGSGLGDIADSIIDPITIPYAEIPGFPQSSVAGHKGRLVVGQLGCRTVICLQGRFHLYEGHDPQVINTVIQTLKVLGVQELIVTNAAGSLHFEYKPGSLMMISDHINFSGRNPLVGPDDEKFGPRFPSLSDAYPEKLRNKMREIAKKENIVLHEGVYLMVLGPNFETAAEIKAFRILGADAVGMSTVPEVICAVRCGIKVLGISVLTNFGTGMAESNTSHDETLNQGKKACSDLATLIKHYLEE